MDQLTGILAHDLGPENPASARIRQDLYVSVGRVHQYRLAVIVEGIGRREILDSPPLEVPFLPSNRRQLRVREYDDEEHRVPYRFQPLCLRGMPGRQFPLLDGNMDDLVGSAAIARRIDVRRARLLPTVGGDP